MGAHFADTTVTGGVHRPMAPTRGTVPWTSTSRMSGAAATIYEAGFPFVASGIPSEGVAFNPKPSGGL